MVADLLNLIVVEHVPL